MTFGKQISIVGKKRMSLFTILNLAAVPQKLRLEATHQRRANIHLETQTINLPPRTAPSVAPRVAPPRVYQMNLIAMGTNQVLRLSYDI